MHDQVNVAGTLAMRHKAIAPHQCNIYAVEQFVINLIVGKVDIFDAEFHADCTCELFFTDNFALDQNLPDVTWYRAKLADQRLNEFKCNETFFNENLTESLLAKRRSKSLDQI
ncbi:MAG: hypothetical protein ACD_39C01738G0005 [uncultured bacterium]|nr:MAG: hypothetical protein ACD_39C01738G0005 [uncultured bacterium]